MNLAIIQARMTSQRLPGKVLKSLYGKPMILRQIERIKQCKHIDKIVIATSIDKSDDVLVDLCKDNSIHYYRGEMENVLSRFYQIAKKYQPEHIVRITADCPLIDPQIIDRVIEQHLETKSDYTSNTLLPTYPDGLDVEVMTKKTLEIIYKNSKRPSLLEHVTLYVHENKDIFNLQSVENAENLSALRWTVDEYVDYEFVKVIYENLYPLKKFFLMDDVIKFLSMKPAVQNMNEHISRNEGLANSIEMDNLSEEDD